MVKVSRTRRGAAPQRTLKDVRNEHKHGGKQDVGKGPSIFTKENNVTNNQNVQQQTTNQTSTTNPINEQQSGNVKKSKKQLRHEYELEKAKKYREKQQAKAENSEWKAKVHQESAAKAKVAKAEHNATTNPNANEKKVHKELKKAEQINPGSTKNVNEKELLNTLEENKKKATAPVKPATPTVAPSGAGAVTGGAGTATGANKVATEEASHVAQTAAKSGSKFTKFLKKGGKIGAALLVIGGLFYGIKKLFGGGDDDKKTQANTPVQEQKDTPAPADKTKKPAKGSDGETASAPVGSDSPTQPAKGEEKADDKAKPADKKDPAKATPAPVSGDEKETKESDKADKPDKAEDKNRALPKNYTVKKGDNVWNIAKRRLQEMNGKKPTDREIMNYTNELLKLNKLEYEPDGYTVIIHKGDNIEYAA